MEQLFNPNEWADRLAGLGFWAIVLSLAVSIVISVLGVVPSVFWSGVNALVFGMAGGFWISLAGETIGAGISYWLYGKGIRRTKLLAKYDRVLRRLRGRSRMNKMFWLLFARVMPLLPSGAVTLLAVLAAMNVGDFLLATMLGKAPSVALETLVGHDLYTIKENYNRLLFVAAAVVAGIAGYRAIRRVMLRYRGR